MGPSGSLKRVMSGIAIARKLHGKIAIIRMPLYPLRSFGTSNLCLSLLCPFPAYQRALEDPKYTSAEHLNQHR
jgi:hypothetical protein